MPQDMQQWIGPIMAVAVALVVLTLRMRKMQQARPLKIERLWMLPAFYAAVVAALYVTYPPHGVIWLYALAALAVGLTLGWIRGKLMVIHVDPATHEVSQQGSRLAMLFIVVLVGLRFTARAYMGNESQVDPAVMLATTDVLLAFGFGFIAAQRLEMGMRAKELLAEARTARP
ncbi:MAG TPA: CcdC protein domain-containing protein [Sphingobium sp.]